MTEPKDTQVNLNVPLANLKVGDFLNLSNSTTHHIAVYREKNKVIVTEVDSFAWSSIKYYKGAKRVGYKRYDRMTRLSIAINDINFTDTYTRDCDGQKVTYFQFGGYREQACMLGTREEVLQKLNDFVTGRSNTVDFATELQNYIESLNTQAKQTAMTEVDKIAQDLRSVELSD